MNDFQQDISTAFEALRKDIEFTDVTLACEDGNQVEAHKVVLAASSPFFLKLKRNKHIHPLIYLRDLKLDDILAVVDLFYRESYPIDSCSQLLQTNDLLFL